MVAQQGFPYLDTPLVDSDGRISIPWYRFFVQLWKATGGSTPISAAVYLQQVGAQLVAYDTATNTPIGVLVTSGTPGGARVVVALSSSPHIYAPGASGTFVAYGGQVELSRDAGANWNTVGLVGGAVPLLKDDQVRVTWFDITAPVAAWFPDAA